MVLPIALAIRPLVILMAAYVSPSLYHVRVPLSFIFPEHTGRVLPPKPLACRALSGSRSGFMRLLSGHPENPGCCQPNFNHSLAGANWCSSRTLAVKQKRAPWQISEAPRTSAERSPRPAPRALPPCTSSPRNPFAGRMVVYVAEEKAADETLPVGTGVPVGPGGQRLAILAISVRRQPPPVFAGRTRTRTRTRTNIIPYDTRYCDTPG